MITRGNWTGESNFDTTPRAVLSVINRIPPTKSWEICEGGGLKYPYPASGNSYIANQFEWTQLRLGEPSGQSMVRPTGQVISHWTHPERG